MSMGYNIGIYILTLIAVLMGIFVVNWVFTFYKLWSVLQIESISIRRPKSVLLFGILCALSLLVRNPIQFFLSLDEELFNKMYFIQNILLHFTTIGMVYILVYRTWIVYYDIKWNRALEDEQWQSQINTDTLKQSWFIKNRQIYRKTKYVIIILFIPWFILCSIGSVSVLTKGRSTISLLFYALNLFTPILCLITLTAKMPIFNDYYKLRKETKMLSIISIVCLISFVFLSIALKAQINEWKWIILQFIHISLLFTLSIVSYYWVFKQFNLPMICCSVHKYKPSFQLNKMVRSKSVIDVNNEQKDKHQNKFVNMHLIHVLQDDELFLFYARHLGKEFCIENLLFFVESHQFITYVLQHSDIQKTSEYLDNKIHLSAKNIPKSTIVNDLVNSKEKENSINIAAINLFLKYIDSNTAYFLINISFGARKHLLNIFGLFDMNTSVITKTDNINSKKEFMKNCMIANNITPNQIYDAFYETRLEIFALLSSSFTRFKIKMINENDN